jgi:hypothetical protein
MPNGSICKLVNFMPWQPLFLRREPPVPRGEETGLALRAILDIMVKRRRDIFVMEHARVPFWKLFISRTQSGTVFWNLFFMALVLRGLVCLAILPLFFQTN